MPELPPKTPGRPDRKVLLVTGSIGSGKTELLVRLQGVLRRWWGTCGFFCLGAPRPHRSRTPATVYRLSLIGRDGTLPWAERRSCGHGFEFREDSRVRVGDDLRADLEQDGADVCFVDEIGRLEVEGRGFADLFRRVLRSRCGVVIAAVRKDHLDDVRRIFGLEHADAIDLDEVAPARALRLARRRVAASDAERIGVFAGIAGLVEVGLGSTLHAYRVPFKGHALAYLQNALLITFGKSLRGRGLLRISLVAAMLKAFSPMGARFRPMAYIFVQGACFAAPVRALGWNIASVLLGSVFMGWLTLALSLIVDYVMFGASIFDAFSGVIAAVSGWIGVRAPSLLAVICGVFVFKAVLSATLAVVAYCGSLEGLVRRLSRRVVRRRGGREPRRRIEPSSRSAAGHALAALRDLVRPRFLIAFLVSMLLLLFFANLSAAGFLSVLVRGLCISYLAFVAMRRINILRLGQWIDRRMGMDLGRSLPAAFRVLERLRPAEARADADPGKGMEVADEPSRDRSGEDPGARSDDMAGTVR